ncbi:50S ribosomal protein L16 [candidate division WWE3 bacterium CG08_land_8_20_14_0_20_43_13]|uniref:Large ribosomal subunit protein uL16 n=1 Tax=candidate division WWE3 bacterium CG08_land_8_20_14_0_20_43_13 TaxID=1975087 RepID=A0A2H0X9C6_UNCKA|nr:MAG: 50S ribosomal protein L16 [candidate division WWE3 bacterium CG08_land_8_20_14_0_20_43_13]
MPANEPKRLKYRKQFRGRTGGKAWRGSTLSFGDYGLQVVSPGRLTARQIESARKAISHYTKRSGKIWILVFPQTPVTKRPPEVRMGKGKGPVDHYEAFVRTGKIIFELTGVTEDLAREAFTRASHKLPIPTRYLSKEGEVWT